MADRNVGGYLARRTYWASRLEPVEQGWPRGGLRGKLRALFWRGRLQRIGEFVLRPGERCHHDSVRGKAREDFGSERHHNSVPGTGGSCHSCKRECVDRISISQRTSYILDQQRRLPHASKHNDS